MGRGLSELQKDVLSSCFEALIESVRTSCRPRMHEKMGDIYTDEIVLLAGNGKRTPVAEATASRTTRRLVERGLILTRADIAGWGNYRYVWLSDEGIEKASELFPKLATRYAREKAAAEKRAAKPEKVKKLSKKELAVLEKRVNKAMLGCG